MTTLESTINGISTLTKGQKNSLIAKLEAASDAAARGNNTASHNQMSAFLNELRADMKTGKVTAAQVSSLTDAIHAIEAALGTYNRILQWWPLEP
jgi:PBP1b-binding outer membrane lipoprotein LpoB